MSTQAYSAADCDIMELDSDEAAWGIATDGERVLYSVGREREKKGRKMERHFYFSELATGYWWKRKLQERFMDRAGMAVVFH